MSRGWKIAAWIGGAVWAVLIVAITVSPHEAWRHLVEWWQVIAAGIGLLALAVGLIHGVFRFFFRRNED